MDISLGRHHLEICNWWQSGDFGDGVKLIMVMWVGFGEGGAWLTQFRNGIILGLA